MIKKSNDNTPPTSLIEVKEVSLRIQDNTILENINLNLNTGETVALIGPNGAGKSSLVRLILGLTKATTGSVYIKPETRIGYVPQKFSIDNTLPLTVQRFLTLGGRYSTIQLNNALSEVGAQKLLNSPIQSISGGETQRIMLARALLRKPELLILDEPAQGVDVTGQAELYELISSIRENHRCGILMVSHDLHFVMATTNRVLCLNRHICCSGHPEAVSHDPRYLELFNRHPSIALYTHHHDHSHDLDGNIISTQCDHTQEKTDG
ncbi:MAG TPA: zinc ABC transporter ATP-binding protein ZnuC [Gammaproteobacteria bacterium]|nr:zinc ABC transporter ATP-binding protein ZnuC [Gammaproteobacteria bacterium]